MAGIAPHYPGFDYRYRLPFGLALESLTKLHAMPVSAVFFSKFLSPSFAPTVFFACMVLGPRAALSRR